jgi:hypothetical protein
MSNIKFHYLYRDGGNYKKWAELVFCDPDALPPDVVAKELRDAFLEDGLFIAHQIRIPEVFLAIDDQLTSDDHCFHEFEGTENTDDAPNDPYGRTIREFLGEVAREAQARWRAFNPRDRLIRKIH